MANTKISALTSVASLAGTETFPIVQSGSTKKAAISDISTLMQSSAPQTTFRNLIHNGNFSVDQRGNGTTHSVAVSTTAFSYYVDRWFANSTGAALTGSLITGLGTSRYNYRLTGIVSNTGFNVGQRVESINVGHLASSTATLQFKVASSSLTTLTYTISYANTADTFGTLGSPTKTTIVTGSVAVTATLTRQTVSFTMPANAFGVEVLFTGGALVAAQTFTLADVQLESGSVATAFETRPYQIELALCQRYINGFTTSTYGNSTGTFTVGNGNSQSTTSSVINIPFSVQLRRKPTTLETPASLASTTLVNGSGVGGVPTAISLSNSGANCGQIVVTTTAGTPTIAAAQPAYLQMSNSSVVQYILFTGAEL